MKAKCGKLWDISKYMFEEPGRFSEKTIAGKIVKIERTSAESGNEEFPEAKVWISE
jgi:hypothetical protein